MVWFSWHYQQSQAQAREIAKIQHLGGKIFYKRELQALKEAPVGTLISPPDDWYRRLLGHDFFDRVADASFFGTQITDETINELVPLKFTPEVHFDITLVTSAGIGRLLSEGNVKRVYIGGVRSEYKGLIELQKKFPDVEIIYHSRLHD